MKEFDDIHKLIEEQTQNPFERDALEDVVSLLAEGALDAMPRESYREELRRRLIAQAQFDRRVTTPWFRRPLAVAAAAAVVMAVAAGAGMYGLGGLGGRQSAATSQASNEVASAPQAGSQVYGLADGATQPPLNASSDDVAVASLPLAPKDEPGQWRDPSAAGGAEAAVSRGLTRPGIRDSAMVKVDPGTAVFTLDTTLPLVPAQLPTVELTAVNVGPTEVTAVAQSLGLIGTAQSGFDHFWVGQALPGQPALTPDLPPYKQAGRWLVAGRAWGNGWSYTLTDDQPVPGTPVASATQAAEAAKSFLARLGVAAPENLLVTAVPEADGGYWADWRLGLNGFAVQGVQGNLRIGAEGGVRYASWPAFTRLVQVSSQAAVLTPQEALTLLGQTPFDWYQAAPKLSITQVSLGYRWSGAAAVEEPAELELTYQFTVHDADGHQSELVVPAWRAR